MSRYGPLHVVAGGLVVGDPTRRHLLLEPDRVVHRDEADAVFETRWDDADAIVLDLPRTRFPFPGAVSAAALAIVALFVQDDPGFATSDGTVTFRLGDRVERRALSRHHPGAYWSAAVGATQRMIDRLVEDPPSRALLRHPESVLRSVRASARRSGGRG